MRYCLIILAQGFCSRKIEITQFPDGFHHKTIPCSAAHTCLGQIKESPSTLQSLGTILKTTHTMPFLCTFACARLLHKL